MLMMYGWARGLLAKSFPLMSNEAYLMVEALDNKAPMLFVHSLHYYNFYH